MTKRIIYIGSPIYISSKLEQLSLEYKDSSVIKLIPLEDIYAIELDNPQITITNNALKKISQYGITLSVCDEMHMPCGLMTPIDGHIIQSQRIKVQANLKVPLKKNIWAQIVTAKITNQSNLLKKLGIPNETLNRNSELVKSGDTTNQEGASAQYYWKHIFKDKYFVRDPDGAPPNNALNYTYAVLRSISARAIISTGFNPSLGLFHKNQYNAYCLADDLMEPFRPFADEIVVEMLEEFGGNFILEKEQKKRLLELSFKEVELNGEQKTIINAFEDVCDNLVKCYNGYSKQLIFPKLC